MFDNKNKINTSEEPYSRHTYQAEAIQKQVNQEIDENKILNRINDSKISPLAKTSNNWDNRQPYKVEAQQQIYKNEINNDKQMTAYTEAWHNRIQEARGQLQNRGVRISGRRFTTGSYKRRLTKDQSSESTEMYKNRTSNTQQLGRLEEIKRTDIFSNTPIKNEMDSPWKHQISSSNNK